MMADTLIMHHQSAHTRSTLYQKLAEMLSYPSAQLLQSCSNGNQDREISQVLKALPYELHWSLDSCNNEELVSRMASEYMRVFELPVDGQPCALYGGVYTGNRREVMEELLRYYRFFGLSISSAREEDLPDSIPTLLEFLQFLTYKEAGTEDSDAVNSIRLTQKDILGRHLTQWIPSIKEHLARRSPPDFYRNIINLLDQFTASELTHLAS